MICKKCGCEDYSFYKDGETGKKIYECQNCGAEIEANIEEVEED